MRWSVHLATRRGTNRVYESAGGEVKLCVSPFSVDNNASPFVTTHWPSGSQANEGWQTNKFTSWNSDLTHNTLWATDGRNDHEGGTPFRYPDKADGAPVRRKGWAEVVSWVRGQPHWGRRANQLDIDVEVVLLLPVPGKGYLIAVRGETGRTLKAHITGGRGTTSGVEAGFFVVPRNQTATAIADTATIAVAQTQLRHLGRTTDGASVRAPESVSSFSS